MIVTTATSGRRQLGGETQVVAGAAGHARESCDGQMLLVMPARDGAALGELLLGQVTARGWQLRERPAEAANIVASACLSAIGQLTRLAAAAHGAGRCVAACAEVVGAALERRAAQASRVVVLEARFSASSAPPVSGRMLLVLERESSQALLAAPGRVDRRSSAFSAFSSVRLG